LIGIKDTSQSVKDCFLVTKPFMIITALFTMIFKRSRKIVKEMTKKTRAITVD